MSATVHHPKCQAVAKNDAAYCNCGGSAFPVYEPDPILENFLRRLRAVIEGRA